MREFPKKKVLLIEDNAGWHRSQNVRNALCSGQRDVKSRFRTVKTPEGMMVEYLPAYSPELQPAESAPPAPRFPRRKDGASRLWTLVDEPLVNQYFETIDEIEELLVQRCNVLSEMKEEIRNLTHYHWLDFL